MSLHELTACIYYKIAIERGLRGCDPDGEYCAHYDGTMLNNDLNIDFSVNDYPVAGVTQVTDYELDDILRYVETLSMHNSISYYYICILLYI
jgi:hypothetical protein